MQAWGASSKFNQRQTEKEPTKSGVIGMIAAALGFLRTDDLEDLLTLRYGVRIDQPGQLIKDFQTARNEKIAFITQRYYLADAVFLVGLEGEDILLKKIEEALLSPVFPLFLGRRSCPPSGRVVLGIREKTLKDALINETWQASYWYQKKSSEEMNLTIVCDAEAFEKDTGAFIRRDVPVTFNQEYRRYGFRKVIDSTNLLKISNQNSKSISGKVKTSHNPMDWEEI
jgi:CRISPR system Cascade subunit CasD